MFTNEYRISNVNGMYWSGSSWTCLKELAEVYTRLSELPKWIDGRNLKLEIHDSDPARPDVRYYADGMMDAEANVVRSERWADDQDDE